MRGKSMRLSNPGSPIATGRDGVSQNVKLAVLESRLDSAIAPAMQVMQETGLTHLQILEKLEDFPFKIKAPEMEAIFEKYTEDEKEALIVNLEPFMDRDPPVCGRSENLSRTYQRLRTMGYHHLYVMDSLPLVTGIITRKDVMEDSTKLKLGEKANRLNISLDDPSYLLTEMPYLPHRNQKKSTAFNNGQEDSGDDEDEEMTKEGDPGHIVV
uniref:CBS domain-containing protein n=1 Tax=Eutreptiella gymnastica TaxID=73025 RepID=A0A6U8MN25_9EUGL|mmetsp:Transcript_84493/g.148223  ORF Transcript_84493/g.148223 Transcript_84493/m.148223 type:complete len:212 (+) Transcript_84493:2-637(+)